MQSLGKQQLEDIMIGAALLGAGGGGSPESATRLIESAVKASPTVKMADIGEVEDSANVCVVAGMGAPKAIMGIDVSTEIVRAFRFLEQTCGAKIGYVVPVEIGGLNTIAPMTVAAHTGVTVVDADGAGRSIPELEMTTYAIYGVPVSPLVIADMEKTATVIYTETARQGENIGRAVVTSYGMHAGIAYHFMSGQKLKEVALAGTISLAGRIGETIRKAKEAKQDPAEAVLKATGGYLLARGRVSKVVLETRAGFDFGSVEVEDGQGEALRVATQNENIVAWRGERVVAIVPDLICFLEEGGQPLTNADIKEGMQVAVIGMKSDPKWREPKARDVFTHALRQLGYEGEYIPIEQLMGK